MRIAWPYRSLMGLNGCNVPPTLSASPSDAELIGNGHSRAAGRGSWTDEAAILLRSRTSGYAIQLQARLDLPVLSHHTLPLSVEIGKRLGRRLNHLRMR